MKPTLALRSLGFILLYILVLPGCAEVLRHKFEVQDASYTRLCANKKILTINRQFPGPTIYAKKGDLIIVDVYNKASHNLTIHWHGVKQPRYPWSDGPEFVTQCPIQPGSKFTQRILLSDEEGTMWWHAHSEWLRATVHGALIVLPKKEKSYPFPKPHAQVPIILGEWWKADVQEVMEEFLANGGDPNVSDAFLMNGQPGDLYSCSKQDTFKLTVEQGKTYLIRLINAVMNNIMFFKIAGHNVTVVGSDAAYTKPLTSDYIVISPGQTIDFLLHADQNPNLHYYMAARVYATAGKFQNTTTTAILHYKSRGGSAAPPPPQLPKFPNFNDTAASIAFTNQLRSLANKIHPINVPLNVTNKFFFTLSLNLRACANDSCLGPFGGRLLASVNNVTLQLPRRTNILEAYYKGIKGVYDNDFPVNPPLEFNYTQSIVPRDLWMPRNGSGVVVMEYDSTVEIVFQGTNVVAGIDHPLHLHGHSFYVVGSGIGNFDRDRDPLRYNLVDPPSMETIAVPRLGWTAIRFRANNPGVWFMHCHFERHISWGMGMVLIVKNGKGHNQQMLPPPSDMPKC